MSKEQNCIIVWDNGNHIFPMGFDPECDGAVCCAGESEDIAMFPTIADARKAIKISIAFAKLRFEQAKTVNVDFLGDSLKHVKIRKLKAQQ